MLCTANVDRNQKYEIDIKDAKVEITTMNETAYIKVNGILIAFTTVDSLEIPLLEDKKAA